MTPRPTTITWTPSPDRCGCHPKLAYPLDIDSVYEALIAPTRAARNAQITNLNHGIATYPRQAK